jgi:hypothetical protein
MRMKSLIPIFLTVLALNGPAYAEDEPRSAEYPIIVKEDSSDLQIIYDQFGVISDVSGLRRVKLGEHSPCPISTDTLVAGWKRRELESKGVPLIRFCAAMSDNSWYWFDPETGRRRADYRMISREGLGATIFFKPIPCFLAAGTRIDVKAREIRPDGCVFRYNPTTGRPISEGEGRALAKRAVFAFGPAERGGTVEDKERLGNQSSRRLSPAIIKVIKDN